MSMKNAVLVERIRNEEKKMEHSAVKELLKSVKSVINKFSKEDSWGICFLDVEKVAQLVIEIGNC